MGKMPGALKAGILVGKIILRLTFAFVIKYLDIV